MMQPRASTENERNPYVTIIIPVFNDRKGAEACLQSLTTQDYPFDKFEVLIIDNGSDQPLEIVGDYAFKLRVLHCEKPGSYAARNVGVEAASGDTLFFTDADCIPSSNWIRNGLRGLAGKIDVVIGGEVLFLPPEKLTGVAIYQLMTGFQQEKNINQKGFTVTANLICTSSTFTKVGLFNESLLSGGDLEWSQRASGLGMMINFDPTVVVYTAPRISLKGAVRQARRVAAGRIALRETGLAIPHTLGHAHNIGIFRSAWGVISYPSMTISQRIRALIAAIIIRSATEFEKIRLRLGAIAERR